MTPTFAALTAAREKLHAAREAHDTLIQQPDATSEQIIAAFRAFEQAEREFDAALRADKEAADDAEAEREHLAGQAARTEAAAYELDYAKHPTSVTLASGLIIPTKSILSIVKQDGQDFVRTKMLAGAHPVHADAAATIRALMADLGNTYAALHPDAITTELTRLFPEPAPAKREPRPTDLTPAEIQAINDALALESTRERRGPESLALDLAVDVRAAMNAGDWDGVSALGVLLARKGAA